MTQPVSPSRPARRIGIIGGGQLAWMMAEAAADLGLSLAVQTPSADDPAVSRLADRSGLVLAAVDDATATAELARRCEVLTFENEFVNLAALEDLARAGARFRPRLAALRPLLDKFDQRRFLAALGLPVPRFAALDGAIPETWPDGTPVRFPAVLKTRRHGYDGQGTAIAADRAALEAYLKSWGDRPLLLEEFVPFERELAVVAARSQAGEVAIYPIAETEQEGQVCRRVWAPAAIAPGVAQAAAALAARILAALDAAGTFGVELFLAPGDRLLVNEIAPRVHNSGHFTLDACATSQFEQHLRAVAGLPLGATDLRWTAAAMVNLLGVAGATGDYRERRDRLAALPDVRVHWYGKAESRPGRKLGHATALANGPDARAVLAERVRAIEAIWSGAIAPAATGIPQR